MNFLVIKGLQFNCLRSLAANEFIIGDKMGISDDSASNYFCNDVTWAKILKLLPKTKMTIDNSR